MTEDTTQVILASDVLEILLVSDFEPLFVFIEALTRVAFSNYCKKKKKKRISKLFNTLSVIKGLTKTQHIILLMFPGATDVDLFRVLI